MCFKNALGVSCVSCQQYILQTGLVLSHFISCKGSRNWGAKPLQWCYPCHMLAFVARVCLPVGPALLFLTSAAKQSDLSQFCFIRLPRLGTSCSQCLLMLGHLKAHPTRTTTATAPLKSSTGEKYQARKTETKVLWPIPQDVYSCWVCMKQNASANRELFRCCLHLSERFLSISLNGKQIE